METLPIEVVKLISYQLPPFTLTINKEFSAIYNDVWYRDYLNVLYPECDLWLQTTYKDLYERSLQMRSICVFTDLKSLSYNKRPMFISEFPIKCMHACLTYNTSDKLMLNFNGDLYRGDGLIAKKVLFIDPTGYATKDKWHLFGSDREIHILDPILRLGSTIYSGSYFAFALTEQVLYIYSYAKHLLISIPFVNAKDIMSDGLIYVLQHNGDVYIVYPPTSIKELRFNDIVRFHGDRLLTGDGKYMSVYGNYWERPMIKTLSLPLDTIYLDSEGTVEVEHYEDGFPIDFWWDIYDIYRHGDHLYLVK